MQENKILFVIVSLITQYRESEKIREKIAENTMNPAEFYLVLPPI